MAQQNDVKQIFEGYKSLAFLLTILLIIVNFYFYYYRFFDQQGLNNSSIDYLLLMLYKIKLFKHPIIIVSIITFLQILFTLFDKGKKKTEINKEEALIYTLIGLLFFFGSAFTIKYISNIFIYALLFLGGFLALVRGFTLFSRIFSADVLKDRFNKRNKIFPQETELVANPMSVNIPFKFVKDYTEKKNKLTKRTDFTPIYEQGYVNLVAPQRSTIILGKPGSGKSYSFNEEFLKQHIQKGFAFINYDFKFPTLTEMAYNYLDVYGNSYIEMYGKPVRFGTICIDQPRYSSRCNPIANHLLEKISDAEDAVYTIFFNIDKKSAQKQDFFQMSAMSFTKAVMWFLKMYDNGKYLSLPHVIEFIQHSDKDIIPILASYPELFYSISSFSDASEKEAYDQLAGQTSSARIPLGKLATQELFYVMTDPDGTGIDLQVNKKENVTFLNIANHPKTQKTNGPALGLYLSQAAKLINVQSRDVVGGTVPCNFHVDELPTTYINNLKELIATARSNNITPTLAFQDYSQLVLEYGKETADNIFNTVDNILCGKVAIDTAEKISKMIGNAQFQQQSVTINQETTSESFNTQASAIVPASDISMFSQGEFCGIVSDSFTQQIELKAFRGFISPDKSDQTNLTLPPFTPDLTEQDLMDNMKMIQEDIKFIIKKETERLHHKKQLEQEQAAEDDEDIIDETSFQIPNVPKTQDTFDDTSTNTTETPHNPMESKENINNMAFLKKQEQENKNDENTKRMLEEINIISNSKDIPEYLLDKVKKNPTTENHINNTETENTDTTETENNNPDDFGSI